MAPADINTTPQRLPRVVTDSQMERLRLVAEQVAQARSHAYSPLPPTEGMGTTQSEHQQRVSHYEVPRVVTMPDQPRIPAYQAPAHSAVIEAPRPVEAPHHVSAPAVTHEQPHSEPRPAAESHAAAAESHASHDSGSSHSSSERESHSRR